MIFPFNRPEIADAIARFLGIKDRLGVAVDSTVIPVLTVGPTLDRTPYSRFGVPVCENQAVGAVAANFGVVWIQPGRQVALSVHKAVIANQTAGAQTFSLRALTAANIATIGGGSGVRQVFDMSAQEAGWGSLRGSAVVSDHHTSIEGNGLMEVSVPVAGTVEVEFDPPFVLYGNDPGGVPGLGFFNNNDDDAITAISFFGREWPLPG